MAIQMRRGLYNKLDPSKLVGGEVVIATDNGFVGIAKAPSDLVQLATQEDLEEVVIDAVTVENGVLIFGESNV